MHKPLAKKKNQPFQASSYKHLSLVIIYLYLSSEYHGINYMDKGCTSGPFGILNTDWFWYKSGCVGAVTNLVLPIF